MPDIYQDNLAKLRARFPVLAERVDAYDADLVAVTKTEDGGYGYAIRQGDSWQALTNLTNPIEVATNAVRAFEATLAKTTNPALIVGLRPGFELDMVYRCFDEAAKKQRFFRRIYVVITSTPCLIGWLKAMDRSQYLRHDDIEFYWHEDIPQLVELLETNRDHSHSFMPMSSLPENQVNTIIEPLAQLFVRRQEETERMKAENDAYYDALTDDELGSIIAGEGDRKPRLMFPTHTSSTVVQYSARDLCAAMEEQGWETLIHTSTHGCSNWEVVKTINEFKPDVYITANHLRTESKSDVYPKNMMFITWVQDTCSYINNRQAAEEWNNMAGGHKEVFSDLSRSAGSVSSNEGENTSDQEGASQPSAALQGRDIPAQGDALGTSEESLVSSEENGSRKPEIGSQESLSTSPKDDSTSPTGDSTSDKVAIELPQSDRKRDLIIGYVGQLKPYGYREDRLVEMPMIVNTNIFRPRELTEEEKEKYGCDVMFASNCGAPTEERIDELYDDFNHVRKIPTERSLLQTIHDHIWAEYRAEKTFTSEDQLRTELLKVDGFGQWFADLTPGDQDCASQRIFWRLNDVIYRQVVIEWLDDYAQEHPDFKLHLYGEGWDKHPRFAKYHRGVLQHGEELSIAYQAAKHCLHLNSTEGGHQRVLEILLSGADVMSRAGTSRPRVPYQILLAYEQILGASTLEQVCQNDIGICADWFFDKVLELLDSDSDPSLESLQQMFSKKISEQLFLVCASYVSYFRNRPDLVRHDVQEALTDGRGQLPRFAKRDFTSSLQAHILHSLAASPETASPRMKLIAELAKLVKYSYPISDIEKAFQALECSGNSIKLAVLEQYLAINRYQEAAALCDSIVPSALCGTQHSRLASARIRIGWANEALAHVEQAYDSDPTVRDGYTAIAWQLCLEGDYDQAFAHFERDYRLERMSSRWQYRLCNSSDTDAIKSPLEERITAVFAAKNETTLQRLRHHLQWDQCDRGSSQILGRISGEDFLDLYMPAKNNALPPVVVAAAGKLLLEQMRQEQYVQATELAEGLNLVRFFEQPLPEKLKILLQFLDNVLLGSPPDLGLLAQSLQLVPGHCTFELLRPYFLFLSRKAEVGLSGVIENRAAEWLIQALRIENMQTRSDTHVLLEARWLVHTGRHKEALSLVTDHCTENSDCQMGHTRLAFYFALHGNIEQTKRCLNLERGTKADPILLLISSFCHLVCGQFEECREQLVRACQADSKLFISEAFPSKWGIYSLILKGLGHKTLAHKADAVAEQVDPHHHFRKRLWNLVLEGSGPHPIPEFKIPRGFDEC